MTDKTLLTMERLRMRAGLTQTELGRRINLAQSTLSLVENGYSSTTVAILKKIWREIVQITPEIEDWGLTYNDLLRPWDEVFAERIVRDHEQDSLSA